VALHWQIHALTPLLVYKIKQHTVGAASNYVTPTPSLMKFAHIAQNLKLWETHS